MNLFGNATDAATNLLPRDGAVFYYGQMLSLTESDQYLKALLADIEWKNDEAIIFGKHIITKRKVAWYGDAAFEYRYSKITKTALPFTKELQLLKQAIERLNRLRAEFVKNTSDFDAPIGMGISAASRGNKPAARMLADTA